MMIADVIGDNFEELLGDFLDESSQLIERLSADLLTLDQLVRGAGVAPGDEDLVNRMFRSAHSIKGLSAMLGLTNINSLTHNLEHVFDAARRQELQFDVPAVEAMFQAVDRLAAMIAHLKDTGADGLAADEALAAIDQVLAQHRSAAGASESDSLASSPAGPMPPRQAAFDEDLLDSIALRTALEPAVTVGCLRFEAELPLAGMKARLAYEKLAQMGRVAYCDPPLEELAERDDLATFAFVLAGGTAEAEIRKGLRLSGIVGVELRTWREFGEEARCELERWHAAIAATTKQKASAAAEPAPGGRAVETIRVDMERLDQLMNLSGQLAINRACFAQIVDSLKTSLPGKQISHTAESVQRTLQVTLSAAQPDRVALDAASLHTHLRRLQRDVECLQREMDRLHALRRGVTELSEAVHQLDRVAANLQKTVMDTRMAPIGPLFQRFHRVVRDTLRNSSKDVRLEIEGERTELDKRMIDELSDPLIHMVRNSIDHGLESKEERRKVGKPEQGMLRLEARHQGNTIVIEVRDDGRGLDRAKILRKGVERGLISQLEADTMTDAQAYELIWRPGFSTADTITQISGRGIGMDIVRAKIEELHGAIETSSQPGQGATFTIRLPLTLAILPTLMAEIGGEVFAFPIESVVEIVKVPRADLLRIQGAQAARIRDRVVAVARLEELLADPQSATFASSMGDTGRPTVAWPWEIEEPSQVAHAPGDGACSCHPALPCDVVLVVVGADRREVGVPVDALLGEKDVVIKSLAENYRNVPGVSGASILGDGRVSLILDPLALVESACARTTEIA